MDSCKFESNSGTQTALALGCMAVGIILARASRYYQGTETTNSFAGFLLGIMLLIIGLFAFLAAGRQTISIDLKLRRIIIEDTNRFGVKRRLIPFSDIISTNIGYFGKASNFVNFYYINLKLSNGRNYPLFAPGRFFEGGSDRPVMESRLKWLENCIKPAGE